MGVQDINLTRTRFTGSENGWTNSCIALNWLINNFDPATCEKAGGCTQVIFLDGHSSHFSLELLRKAQELDIKLIAYPTHCTRILQGLDTVTCSFLVGADQVSESRTRGFECWTRYVVECVRLPVARGSDETCGDSDEIQRA